MCVNGLRLPVKQIFIERSLQQIILMASVAVSFVVTVVLVEGNPLSRQHLTVDHCLTTALENNLTGLVGSDQRAQRAALGCAVFRMRVIDIKTRPVYEHPIVIAVYI